MRTNGPTQHDEPPAVYTTRWGLGACSTNERWYICDRYVSENGTGGTRDGLMQTLVRGGCPNNIAELTLQTWFQAGLLIHDGVHVSSGTMDSHGSLRALQPPARHEGHTRAGTNVALLSLFDGTGLARIAVDEAIQDCGGICLVQPAFVEHDRTLARRVAAVWNNEVSNGRTTVAHTSIASDMWDLCRAENRPLGTHANDTDVQTSPTTPLGRFAQSLPAGCITIIVAGSPCQQFTYAGRYRGQQGLCGPDSVLFFAVPTVAWILQELRPDTVVHLVLENAASMHSTHRAAIMQALGGLNTNEHLRTLDSGTWSAFPRRRHYFMTLPDRGDLILPTGRDTPWEPGWGPIPSAVLYPMMCSRDNVNPRASTIQYVPRSVPDIPICN